LDLDDVLRVKRSAPVDDVFPFGEVKLLRQEQRDGSTIQALETLAIEFGGPE
jgi:hypothetical protein